MSIYKTAVKYIFLLFQLKQWSDQINRKGNSLVLEERQRIRDMKDTFLPLTVVSFAFR